ncbi:Phage Mu-like virion morphogenesis protein [Moraxella catarrhalis]|uniref:phage head morphogenesis protein n=1 Tax=Moraxella catarrhalis TaxID=480 RepID=UPI0007E368C5|nr:phage minor head protein [Moraxella catarrhalis]OAV23658.1 Phage Mu-like virion morphogenesis protein [Moraxella catarrhalis]
MSSIDKLTNKELKALFDMPPEKAIEHLKSKGLHIGWDWTDTHALAHARSFTVAKMTALDMLSTTKKAIEQAMTDGTGYKGFETTIKPYLISQGWWGETVARNPKTDQLEQVRLGSNRRLKTIYHTNRRTAVMTAKYERMKQASDTHPYWQYSAVLDRRTRPSHSAKHGAVYAHDDLFWSHSYPPNGFGCRCTVKAITAKHAQRVGIDKSNDETTVLGENGFGGSPVASHLFDKLWYDKAKHTLGQKHALQAIAKDMASDVRAAGFLAWVRQSQKTGYAQGRTYGVGVLSQKSFEKLANETGLDLDELSPVVGFRDKVITGRKNTRHTVSSDALDTIALERIVRSFGKPDYELWDTLNNNLLLIYKTDGRQAIKLTVQNTNQGLEVISGFYQDLVDIEGQIKGGIFIEIK